MRESGEGMGSIKKDKEEVISSWLTDGNKPDSKVNSDYIYISDYQTSSYICNLYFYLNQLHKF